MLLISSTQDSLTKLPYLFANILVPTRNHIQLIVFIFLLKSISWYQVNIDSKWILFPFQKEFKILVQLISRTSIELYFKLVLLLSSITSHLECGSILHIVDHSHHHFEGHMKRVCIRLQPLSECQDHRPINVLEHSLKQVRKSDEWFEPVISHTYHPLSLPPPPKAAKLLQIVLLFQHLHL